MFKRAIETLADKRHGPPIATHWHAICRNCPIVCIGFQRSLYGFTSMKNTGIEIVPATPKRIDPLDDVLVNNLKSLTRLLIDSEDGLSDASENIGNAEIAALFRSITGERNKMATELQDLIRDFGDEAPVSGTISGALHRTWLDLRNSLSGQDPHSILVEAERGENYMKREYEIVLSLDCETAVHSVLSDHYLKVKAAHDRVRGLRDSYAR